MCGGARCMKSGTKFQFNQEFNIYSDTFYYSIVSAKCARVREQIDTLPGKNFHNEKCLLQNVPFSSFLFILTMCSFFHFKGVICVNNIENQMYTLSNCFGIFNEYLITVANCHQLLVKRCKMGGKLENSVYIRDKMLHKLIFFSNWKYWKIT